MIKVSLPKSIDSDKGEDKNDAEVCEKQNNE
jgi:hypothetical protein